MFANFFSVRFAFSGIEMPVINEAMDVLESYMAGFVKSGKANV